MTFHSELFFRKSSGRVDIYDVIDGRTVASLIGDSEFAQFGYSVHETTLFIESSPKKVLVVASPTYTYDAGQIYEMKLHL